MDEQQNIPPDDYQVIDAPTQVTLLDEIKSVWAYIAHHPAGKTEAGSLIPPSESLIRVTTPDYGTVALFSAIREELDFMRKLAQIFSQATGLKVTLRRFPGGDRALDEEEIVDGRVRNLQRVTLFHGSARMPV